MQTLLDAPLSVGAGPKVSRRCDNNAASSPTTTTRDAEHELNIEISENDVRKGFTKSERVDYIKRLLRIEQAKAKERMEEGRNQHSPSENSHEGYRADEVTASHFGISSNTMCRELFIADNADLLDPADFAEWDEGKHSSGRRFYARRRLVCSRSGRERPRWRPWVCKRPISRRIAYGSFQLRKTCFLVLPCA